MPITRPFSLTAAERARTTLAGCVNVRVRVPGLSLEVHRHGLAPDGSLLFGAPPDLIAGYAEAEALDVSGVPQPDRVRGLVQLAGPLTEVAEALPAGLRAHLTGTDDPEASRVLRLTPETVTLDWRCEDRTGPRDIPVPAYRSALPDPLLAHEAAWLPHLQADHGEVLEVMACHELGLEEDADVRALGLDRFGLVLRVRDQPTCFDVRIAFDRPVCCGCDLREAFGALVTRAGLGGHGPVC